MPPKRPAIGPVMSPSVAKKTRKSLTLKVKLDFIHRHERNKKTNIIARHHGLTPSTVSTIFKSADSIKKAGEIISSLQAKRITQTHDSAMDKMESLVEIGWKRLLHENDPVVDFEDFEADDFYRWLLETGEQAILDDVQDWLDCNEGGPDMQVLTEHEIVETWKKWLLREMTMMIPSPSGHHLQQQGEELKLRWSFVNTERSLCHLLMAIGILKI
ncbi:CENPB DNA-binding domain-containing protein 1 [Portunus trituberculatus]|uniref:CENPB DNA-binding domain-containing protein 1 n=1 Tax=Portunus trituberculatus TaxID=210409 RepID=A0A5B7ENQ1_PORTR|nr:CENPB DNA-binding domain-containing protein 1 [Portunus trituberculatus]